MTGVYSPLLALYTLGLIIYQSVIQAEAKSEASLQYTASLMKQQVDLFSNQLEIELDRNFNGIPLGEYIAKALSAGNIECLQTDGISSTADELNKEFPKVLGLWRAICESMSTISAIASAKDGHYASLIYALSWEAVRAKFGPRTCAALDNYLAVLEKKLQRSTMYRHSTILENRAHWPTRDKENESSPSKLSSLRLWRSIKKKSILLAQTRGKILERGETPHVILSTRSVFPESVRAFGSPEGILVLDVSTLAASNFNISGNQVSFEASFGGEAVLVRFSVDAVIDLISKETGVGVSWK